MATIDPQALEKLCYNEQGILKTKSNAARHHQQADFDDMIDIDEAENHVDKFYVRKLLNEPTLRKSSAT
jgi:hypothetical protein